MTARIQEPFRPPTAEEWKLLNARGRFTAVTAVEPPHPWRARNGDRTGATRVTPARPRAEGAAIISDAIQRYVKRRENPLRIILETAQILTHMLYGAPK